MSCPDIPQAAVTSYATIGLSNSQYRTTDDNLPLGVEILGACGSSFELFPNVLSSIYFQVISGQECAPNSVFRNVVASNNASKTMSHVLLVDPFVWSKSLPNLRFKDKTVSWLQSVPMSDGELTFFEENGLEALHDLFSERQIDVYNLDREPVCQ